MAHPESTSGTAAGATLRYRQFVLALIVIGAAGLLAELLLLEHFEEPWQWAPLVLLGLTILGSAWITFRPGRTALRFFQGVMIGCVVFGSIGVFLHLNGNVQFELESAPDMGGWTLIWTSLRGGVPTLAPGALAQLGLLGLLFAYRHPAARTPPGNIPHQETA